MDELRNLIRRNRLSRNTDERLRQAAGCLTESRGLAAREDDRFHYCVTRVSGSAVSGSVANGEAGLPIPS